MSEKVCPQCGAPIDPNAAECKFCGEKLAVQQTAQTMAGQQVVNPQTVVIQQQPVYVSGINPSWPVKNKMAAGLLAIFLGCFGVHKFYLVSAD